MVRMGCFENMISGNPSVPEQETIISFEAWSWLTFKSDYKMFLLTEILKTSNKLLIKENNPSFPANYQWPKQYYLSNLVNDIVLILVN